MSFQPQNVIIKYRPMYCDILWMHTLGRNLLSCHCQKKFWEWSGLLNKLHNLKKIILHAPAGDKHRNQLAFHLRPLNQHQIYHCKTYSILGEN